MLKRLAREVNFTLPSDREIAFSCTFEWPAQLLFDAWTQPEHLKHWWGCDGSTLTVCEVQLHPGGSWRFVLRMADGSDHQFRGVYREIIPNKRLVYTECYEMPSVGNPEWLTSVSFDSTREGTKVKQVLMHKSQEIRDRHLQVGMEAGMVQTFNRLERQAALMAAKP